MVKAYNKNPRIAHIFLKTIKINFGINIFQAKFSRIFAAAQEKCYLICVPTSDSLHDVIIDLPFVGMQYMIVH